MRSGHIKVVLELEMSAQGKFLYNPVQVITTMLSRMTRLDCLGEAESGDVLTGIVPCSGLSRHSDEVGQRQEIESCQIPISAKVIWKKMK